mmetsp:Transcript_33600/g.75425  ORF Transcript_33600/g.75425 Transcript_33600/m.75425 type:complete len:333 (+) Transcript_33600:20-1018(+)
MAALIPQVPSTVAAAPRPPASRTGIGHVTWRPDSGYGHLARAGVSLWTVRAMLRRCIHRGSAVGRRAYSAVSVAERDVDIQRVGHYSSTWSNPSGAVLTSLKTDLWAAERPFVWNSIDVGGKMAVVRLPCGGLWVHSPVELDEALRSSLDALGPVRHIVSPNFEHVKWAAQWKEAFPEAILWGTPGMREKFPTIPYDEELPRDSEPPRAWGGTIRMCFADCERTPVLGTPFFNEVIFFHSPSSTLICTDIFWNYPSDLPPGSKLWKFLMDKIYLPFYSRFMVRSRASLQAVLDCVATWEVEGLLPCHGTYIPRGGWTTFAQHLSMPSSLAKR